MLKYRNLNSGLNFNPGLMLTELWTTGPWTTGPRSRFPEVLNILLGNLNWLQIRTLFFSIEHNAGKRKWIFFRVRSRWLRGTIHWYIYRYVEFTAHNIIVFVQLVALWHKWAISVTTKILLFNLLSRTLYSMHSPGSS